MTARDRDAGASLLELVAVLAIYSVVAILSLQLLSNAAIGRSQVSEGSVRVAEVAAVASVLRRDLESLMPGSSADPPRFGESGAVFHRAAGPGTALVEWKLMGTDLLRVTEAGEQTMLLNTSFLDFRVIGPSGGWMPGTAFSPARPGDMPPGIEAAFTADAIGQIRVVVAR